MKKNHSIGQGVFIACTGVLFFTAAAVTHADERGGLLVDVQKKVVSRGDQTTPRGVGSSNVDRTLSLKLDIKNNAMREMPEAKIEYIVLIQRWGSETGNIERFQGAAKAEALGISHSGSVLLGEFHIGGHLHGGSEHHVDHIAAWKVIIERDGKKLEFMSTSSFDSLNKRARPGAKK